MKVAGLTGGIASGKSTATKILEKQGIVVVDCDVIAHDVVKKGRWGWKRVVAALGPGVLDATGEVDRAKVGRLVFANKSLRRKLNAATHLPVGVEVVVVDMPLLFETGMHRWVRPRVLVYTEPGTQVRRLIARDGLSAEEAVARLHAQMPLETKLPLADLLINNDGNVQQLEEQVVELARTLRGKAGLTTWLLSPVAVLAGLLAFTGLMLTRH